MRHAQELHLPPPDIGQSPALYPIEAPGSGLRLIRLDEAAYAAASFLDARILSAGRELWTADWAALLSAAHDLPRRAHFIFHIGHAGSTLLSRLLGEHPALFSVREPALLRDLATGEQPAERLAPLLALFSRTWRPAQTAAIKATSFVSEIGAGLLAASDGGRAILLASTPPTYLRTILAGPASRQESLALAASRQARLERRLRASLACRSEGERIAMGWLCETLALHAIAEGAPDRVLWLDFDRLLLEPAATLRHAFARFGARPGDIDVEALAGGPLMTRYSKAPEHAYDAGLRRRLLDQAEREEAVEVRRGMDWLQAIAGAHPQVTSALRRVALTARTPLAGAPPPL